MPGAPTPGGRPPEALPFPTDPRQVPAELAGRPHWVVWYWKPTGRAEKPWTKPPVDPKTGRPAKADDPRTWGTFQQAAAWAQRHGLAGIGIVLTPDMGLTGVDLDGCRDPETGEVAAWALAIVRRLDTYTLVSPSRTGLRLFLKGRLPAWLLGLGRQGRRAGPIEVYQGGHYLTLTTERVPGTPERIEARQDELEAWLAEAFPRDRQADAPETPTGPAAPVPLGDDDLLEAMFAARNGGAIRRLWDGDAGGHANDRSAADQALCNHLAFWTDHDAARMDRLFRRSGLMRAKWERADYRRRTIAKAIAGTAGGYAGPALAIDLGPERRNGHAAPTAPEAPPVKETDLGNALRLIAAHGDDLRYCQDFGRWLVWRDGRFAVDDSGEPARRAIATVLAMLEEAARPALTPERRDALGRWALRSQAAARIAAMLDVARKDRRVAITPADLDADPRLLNTPSGTVETHTGAVRESRRADLITRSTAAGYDPDARCPVWEAVLERVVPDAGVRAFLRRAAGYSLTGSVAERVLFVLFGSGRNGKSTFLETLRFVLGDYAMCAPKDLLLAKRFEGIPNDLARLKGTRFVTVSETDEGRRLDESLVKAITGGDAITARFLHAEWFDFRPEFKVWLATNHKPEVRGTDEGIWDRIRLVPFTVRIPDEEVDPALPERLRAEAPGVLAWAVRGCAEWQTRGLDAPASVLQATEGYRRDMDVLGAFLDEACLLGPQLRVTAKALFAAYTTWCERTGEHAENQRTFGMRLTERGLRRERGRAGWSWFGVGLVEPEEA